MKRFNSKSGDAGIQVSSCFGKSLIALSVATAVFASTGAVAQSRSSALIQEVMVTAQKRSVAEGAQDVPIAISAYSGEKVEAMFAVDLQDVGATAPNVSLAQQGTVPHTGNFIIRGMGTAGQSIPSSDPAVGVVMDGMPYGVIYGVVTDLFDLESVEILRGPQGTLFGRNVTGGAVVMRTTRPSDEFSGKIKGTVGSHDQAEISAMVTGPLADRWSGKLAVMVKNRGGLWDNETLGGQQGASKSRMIHPAIRYDADNFDVTLLGQYAEINGDGPSARNFFLFGNAIDPYKDNTTFTDTKGESNLEWLNLILEANWDLWGGQMTAVGGYRDLEQMSWGDIDGAPGTVRFEFGPGGGLDQEQWSLEVRWDGKITDKLNLTAGVNLFDQEYTYNERRLLIDLFERPASSTIEHLTGGIFAQADYDVTDTVVVTLGGRYSYEKKDAAIGVIGDPGGTGTCSQLINLAELANGAPTARPPTFPGSPPPFDRKINWSDCRQPFQDAESWTNVSPKVGVKWYINEDLMTFATYTRGFRSGGYNVRFADPSLVTMPNNPLSTPGPYDEEVVDAFEIGLKSEFMDGNVRLNASVFYNEYDDLQRSANNQQGVQTIFNAATGTSKGFEIDVVAAVTERLIIEASYGYTDAGYDEAEFLTRSTGKSASDFKFQMVPENTVSAAINYEHPVADQGYLNWRLAYSYVDKVASDDFNFLILPSYELYNASVSFTNMAEDVKVSLFGRNLTDEVYTHFGFDNTAIGSRTIWLAPPRTWGLEVSYKF